MEKHHFSSVLIFVPVHLMNTVVRMCCIGACVHGRFLLAELTASEIGLKPLAILSSPKYLSVPRLQPHCNLYSPKKVAVLDSADQVFRY